MKCLGWLKTEMQYSCVSLLNKHQNLSDHERENLALDQNYGTKDGSVDTSYKGRITVCKHTSWSFTNSWLERFCQTQITLGESMNQSTKEQVFLRE